MADHEFQESEVIFSDCSHVQHPHPHGNFRSNNENNNKSTAKKKKKKMGNKSVPVNIPNNMVFHLAGDADHDEDEWDEGELVPPHLIVRRRIAGKMAFSVCTGNGRTLKGRDLSHVRNSILRMTGFLEA